MMKRIEFFLYPNFVALDVVGPLEVFATASSLLQQQGKSREAYEIAYSGLAPGPVGGTAALHLVAERRLNPASRRDTLIVPGAFPLSENREALALIKDAAAHCRRLVSVCSGAMLLAACGLLNGRRATTHWLLTDHLASSYPQIEVEPSSIYVVDGQVYTSAGVTTGIDLALHLVEEDFGQELAMDVARVLVLYRRRPGSQAQFSVPIESESRVDQEFRSLFRWLERNLHKPLTVEEMAKQVGMSPRNFARVFRQKNGLTPGAFLEEMRTNLARELLECGEDGLVVIAEQTGFLREDRLRRVFQKRMGVTPGQYRFHFRKSENKKKETRI